MSGWPLFYPMTEWKTCGMGCDSRIIYYTRQPLLWPLCQFNINVQYEESNQYQYVTLPNTYAFQALETLGPMNASTVKLLFDPG